MEKMLPKLKDFCLSEISRAMFTFPDLHLLPGKLKMSNKKPVSVFPN